MIVSSLSGAEKIGSLWNQETRALYETERSIQNRWTLNIRLETAQYLKRKTGRMFLDIAIGKDLT